MHSLPPQWGTHGQDQTLVSGIWIGSDFYFFIVRNAVDVRPWTGRLTFRPHLRLPIISAVRSCLTPIRTVRSPRRHRHRHRHHRSIHLLRRTFSGMSRLPSSATVHSVSPSLGFVSIPRVCCTVSDVIIIKKARVLLVLWYFLKIFRL